MNEMGVLSHKGLFPCHLTTRNTLTQASKNGRKPYLFPQKKFVSVFYAMNILSPSIISNRQILIMRRENAI